MMIRGLAMIMEKARSSCMAANLVSDSSFIVPRISWGVNLSTLADTAVVLSVARHPDLHLDKIKGSL